MKSDFDLVIRVAPTACWPIIDILVSKGFVVHRNYSLNKIGNTIRINTKNYLYGAESVLLNGELPTGGSYHIDRTHIPELEVMPNKEAVVVFLQLLSASHSHPLRI